MSLELKIEALTKAVEGLTSAVVHNTKAMEAIIFRAKTADEQAKPVETKAVETKPVETKVVETKPVETKPVETKPVEAKPLISTDPENRVNPEEIVDAAKNLQEVAKQLQEEAGSELALKPGQASSGHKDDHEFTIDEVMIEFTDFLGKHPKGSAGYTEARKSVKAILAEVGADRVGNIPADKLNFAIEKLRDADIPF